MLGDILGYLATFVGIYIFLDLCYCLVRIPKSSPLPAFLFVKRSLRRLLLAGVIFLAIGYFMGRYLFDFIWWSGFICGFVSWIIIGILLSEKKKTVKIF